MKDIIKAILQEWRERELPYLIERDVDFSSYLTPSLNKIITITGFRRTGKTYLAFRIIKELLKSKSKEKIWYINFEDERIPQKKEFLTLLLPTIKEFSSSEVEYLFLDEIQNIPLWSKWLRRIYDTNKNIKIFVTGSSAKLSSKEIPTEMRGRSIEINILPLSFKEFLRFKNIHFKKDEIEYSESKKSEVLKSLSEYLFFGGMPEIALSEESRKKEILQDYYRTVIERDIVERFKIKREENLKALLRLLLNSTYFTITKLYNILKSSSYKVGKTTLQNYISYVENSYFIHTVPLFSYKVKNQMQAPRKLYFLDNGFINALSLKFSKNEGRLLENLVFIELKRRLKKDAEIYYWKDYQQREVDFVIKEEKVKKLIQACADIDEYDTKKRETKSLLRASAELKCDELYIITKEYEKEEIFNSKTIKFIPLWKWLLEE